MLGAISIPSCLESCCRLLGKQPFELRTPDRGDGLRDAFDPRQRVR
jgi:hypothetical protein